VSTARLAIVPIAAVTALALAGCVPNAPAGASAIKVAITDTGCAVATPTASAGPVSFDLTNSGTDVNEFEIYAEDQLRIVGEKENVTPGQTVSYVVQLQPGTYYTACKFQQIGAPIGVAEFTVGGTAATLDPDDQAAEDRAITNYVSYVKSQTEELLPAVTAFIAAYEAGDDDEARARFAQTRAYYERIEPTAEAFGDLDPEIDYREVDALAEGLDWTGFHRIEKDLWQPAAGDLNSDGTDALAGWAPSTPEQRKRFGDGLVEDVQQLYDLVHGSDFTVTLADISNGAIGLLDEVAQSKISGEEDWWSHTDLSDFQANVEGAQVAFENVEDIATAKGGADLVAEIGSRLDALNALLAKYGTIDAGFPSYADITDAQRRELSDAVNALAEPLSQLTHTVLGVSDEG